LTNIEAMKQALEALDAYSWEQVNAARASLRTAIEQAEKQEPVAWAVFEGWNAHDLYLPQEYDEALKMAGYKGDHAEVKPLYTTPPAAQRQPLTEERVWELAANCLDSVAGRLQFARAIEAAHGIGEKK
jgi:hypothetical protein